MKKLLCRRILEKFIYMWILDLDEMKLEEILEKTD